MASSFSRGGRHHLHQARRANVRAGVHDKTRLLADQAIDIGRVQADVTAALHDRLTKGCGETLLEIHHSRRFFTGVDAAVPDGAVTGKLGSGQQVTLAHTATLVQVGAVVPLAHTVGPKANRNRIGRTVQARVQACCFFFFRRQCRWFGRRADFLPELFQRQLLIKAAYRSNRLQQRQGFGALRRCQATGRSGRRVAQQRARLPVNPGGVFAGVLAHGIDGTKHHRPARRAAGAQGSTRLPAQHVVAEVAVFADFRKVARCVAAQAAGGLLADGAPDPVAFFAGELHAPLVFYKTCSAVGVGVGQLDQREHNDLAPHIANRHHLGAEKLHWIGVQLCQQVQRLRGDDLNRFARGARSVGLRRQPGLGPHIVG